MTKHDARALAWVLAAASLLLGGCGDGGGTGGTKLDGGGSKLDGVGSVDSAKLDAHAPDTAPTAVDTAPGIDVAAPVDTTLLADSLLPDAPIVLDGPIAIDVASSDAGALPDAAVPVDLSLPDASMILDVPITIDVALIDVPAPVDVVVPVDATALVDTAATGATDEILWSCDVPSKLHCFDYGGRNNQLPVTDQQSACLTNGGIWSASPCPTANRQATCLMYGGGNPNSGIVTWWRWLAGASGLSVGQQVCVLNGNTWIPG